MPRTLPCGIAAREFSSKARRYRGIDLGETERANSRTETAVASWLTEWDARAKEGTRLSLDAVAPPSRRLRVLRAEGKGTRSDLSLSIGPWNASKRRSREQECHGRSGSRRSRSPTRSRNQLLAERGRRRGGAPVRCRGFRRTAERRVDHRERGRRSRGRRAAFIYPIWVDETTCCAPTSQREFEAWSRGRARARRAHGGRSRDHSPAGLAVAEVVPLL